MHSNLPENLRLLCQYVPSISRVAKDLQINRQQFYRYLNGQSEPPLRRLRLMADYFGLEDAEMLLPHDEFRAIVAVKGVSRSLLDPFGAQVAGQFDITPDSIKRLRPYAGLYFVYLRAAEVGGKINKSLMRMREQDGFMRITSLENYAGIEHRSKRRLRYEGFAYSLGQEIYVQEKEVGAGRMSWTSIVNMADDDQFSILSGLCLGVTSSSQRMISAYRLIWERVPPGTSIGGLLRNWGIHDPNSEMISPSARAATVNDIREGEIGFAARPWRVTAIP